MAIRACFSKPLLLVLSGLATALGAPAPAAASDYGRPSFSASSKDACSKGGLIAVLAYGVFSKGSDRSDIRRSAIAGCLILVGVNEYLESKRRTHANRQQRLLSQIEDLRAHNEELSQVIDEATLSIRADSLAMRQLRIDAQAKNSQERSLRAALANIRKTNDKKYRQLLADAIRVERNWRLVLQAERQTGKTPPELRERINEMRKLIRSLEREYADLNDQYEALVS